MRRRTVDLVVSAGGLLMAVILLVGGLVLTSNANFAKNYVADQLGAQHITFKTADTLTEEEQAKPCLVEYAGQPMTTGKQAECYANNFIGLHLQGIAGGKTYADMGSVQSDLRAQIAAAEAADSPDLADLQAQLDAATAQRDTLFKGETLRGLLLTSYGFSELGAKAETGATVAYIGASLMFILAALGFWHGARTPSSEAIAVPSPAARRERESASA